MRASIRCSSTRRFSARRGAANDVPQKKCSRGPKSSARADAFAVLQGEDVAVPGALQLGDHAFVQVADTAGAEPVGTDDEGVQRHGNSEVAIGMAVPAAEALEAGGRAVSGR